MNLTEKTAYLKGLMEGLDLGDTKEAKVLKVMLELLDELTSTVADLDADMDQVYDELDAIDEDLSDIEEVIFDDEDEDEDEDDCDCDCCDFDCDCYEVTCPACGAVVEADEEAAKQGIVQDILLEINVGQEDSKSGFEVCEVLPLLEQISEFSHIFVRGLMAIPPISQNSGDNRKYFQKILQLSVDIRAKKYDNVLVNCLSMGMSDDYEDAIACGSTMIRVGTAIFGKRNYT